MKEFIKQNWFKVSLLVIIVIIIGGAFYWFQIRPADIRKECLTEAQKYSRSIAETELKLENEGFAITKKADYEKIETEKFNECLINRGLVK